MTSSIKRESNIEFLRLTAMFLIVWFHSIVHGVSHGFQIQDPITAIANHSTVFQTTQLFSITGKTGVALFVIISGYFLINSKFNLNRIKRNWIPTFFYSVLGLIIAYGSGLFTLSLKDFICAFLPIFSNNYWFMTVYLLLILAMPFLNIIWHQCQNKQKLCLIGFLGIFNIILPSLNFLNYPLHLNAAIVWADYSSQFSIFIFYYYIGAYLKELPSRHFLNHSSAYLMGIILSLSGYYLFLKWTYQQTFAFNSVDISFSGNHGAWQLNSIFVTLLVSAFFYCLKIYPTFTARSLTFLQPLLSVFI
ncbi:acyltransferase family protein [Neisseriaceae bacterium ESL0693]|nr:acyltransferase family protein [Neisseriaceae bacterium ESL0693]